MKEYNIMQVYSEQLKREVKIYISLPKNYKKSQETYPVLYLNDGQILFNDYDNKGIGIMEKYLELPNRTDIILVGIASSDSRNDELFPFTFKNSRNGKILGGKANEYMDFIVNSLKPMINRKYRTLSSPDCTGFLGISVGGVTAIYAAAKYPDHFTIFAAISNALTPVLDKLLNLLKESEFSAINKMYLDVGTNESPNEDSRIAYINSNKEIYNILKEKIDYKKLKFQIVKDSKHSEEYWASRFPSIIEFLFT